MYQKAVLEGLDDFPDVDPSIRETLNTELEEKGLKQLKVQLKALDPDYFETADTENPHRVIRALEIYLGTGLPFSSFLNKKQTSRNFKSIKVGLTADREIIYDRINQRVDIMIENGLVDEVKTLYPHKDRNALRTVGYSELFDYLDGKLSLEEAISEIKKNTRRYAKRQLTWYRKQEDITWFDYREKPETIIGLLEVNT